MTNGLNNRFGFSGNRFGAFISIALLFFIRCGSSFYEFLVLNFNFPSIKTVQRAIYSNQHEIEEGKLYARELYDHLKKNNFPLLVTIAEDGTKITEVVEYMRESNTLSGLCTPFNQNGMVEPKYFIASNWRKIKDAINDYPRAKYVNVILAKPVQSGNFFYLNYFLYTI